MIFSPSITVDFTNYQLSGVIQRLLEHHPVLSENTGNIEIVRNDILNKIYFKIPHICKYMSHESMSNLILTVKRNTQHDKNNDFFQKSDLLIQVSFHSFMAKTDRFHSRILPKLFAYSLTLQEMEHRQLLMKKKRSFITNNASYFQDFSFCLALLINFFITTEYETKNGYLRLF